MHGLRDLRVIDLSDRIAGEYATKLLADAHAEVIKVEPPEGDPLRRWSASDQDLSERDGALFQFLNTSKKSVHWVADPGFAGAVERYLIEERAAVAEDIEILTSYGPFRKVEVEEQQ